MKISDLRAG